MPQGSVIGNHHEIELVTPDYAHPLFFLAPARTAYIEIEPNDKRKPRTSRLDADGWGDRVGGRAA